MQRIDDLQAFIDIVQARKRLLGIIEQTLEGARNNGRRRTAEKRVLLAAIQERARAAGVEPLAAEFIEM